MNVRTRHRTVTFRFPFTLEGQRTFPPGDYLVVTDEGLLDTLSFQAFHHLSTMIIVPAGSRSSVELLTIDPRALRSAEDRDAEASGR